MIDRYLTQLETDKDNLVNNLTTMGISGLTGDETFTELVPEVLNIHAGGMQGYTITTNVTDGTYSGASSTYANNEAYVYITPDAGKTLRHRHITVEGASYTYDITTYTIKLYNPTADITIIAACTDTSVYDKVDCIIATGTQYIITDYIPNANTRVEMRMNKPSWNEQWDTMFGSRNRFAFMQYGWDPNDTKLQVEMFGNSQTTGIDIQFNTIVDVVLDASIPLFQYGEQTYTPNLGSSVPNDYLLIFGKRRETGTILDHRSNYKLYYFKIYENDTLMRNYMPALDNNGVPCLYDTVRGKYLYNSGSGTFDYEE